MSREMYDARLAELEALIDAMPPEQRTSLASLLAETKTRHIEIRQNCIAARNALDDWRLAMKYLVFDLEARLRERKKGL